MDKAINGIGIAFRPERDSIPCYRDGVPFCRDSVPPTIRKPAPILCSREANPLLPFSTSFYPGNLWISFFDL